MRNPNDNYRRFHENDRFQVAISSVLGDRADQQDSADCLLSQTGGMVTVCDGMGGHDGGKLASSMTVDGLIGMYAVQPADAPLPPLLQDAADMLDDRVCRLTLPDGTPMRAGTTLVSVVIREQELYWLSVGDSRLYIFRGGELVQITRDHIYRYMLEEQLRTGEITRERYEAELTRGESLVSFIGVGGLRQIDVNPLPFSLRAEDRVLLTTDGLYKLVPDEEICAVLSNFPNGADALQALEQKARRAAKNRMLSRDNMTIALVRMK